MSVNLNPSALAKLPDLPEVLEDKDKPIEIASMPQYQPPPTTAPQTNSSQPASGGKGYTVCEPGSSTSAVDKIYGERNGKSACELQSSPQNTPKAAPPDTGAQQNRNVQPTSGTQVPANTPVKSEASVTQTNKLQGRDPDLIFAGDKIKLSNGAIYTAKSTDTLSGIASKTGNSLESLMKQNGFDSQLLGKNANGKYFDLNKEQQRVQQMPVAPGGSVNSSQGKNTSAVSQSTSTTQSGATQQLDAASSALKKLEAGDTGIKGDDLNKLIQLLTKFVANLQDSKNPALSGDESKDLGTLVEKYRKQLEVGETVTPAAAGSQTPNSDPEPVKPEPKKISEPLPGSAAPPNSIA